MCDQPWTQKQSNQRWVIVSQKTKLQLQKESKFHLSCTFLQGFCNYFKDLHQLSGQVLLLLFRSCCCSCHMTMLSTAPLSFHVSLQLQAKANVLYQMISWATAVDTIQSAERNVQYKMAAVPMIFQWSESITLIEAVTRTSSASHWNVLLEKASSCPQRFFKQGAFSCPWRGMYSLLPHVILQTRSTFLFVDMKKLSQEAYSNDLNPK